MIVLGLTGSIAMGKSTVTKQFAQLGAMTFNSDIAVHEILEDDKKAIGAIAKKFPDAVKNKKIDRKALGRIVFHDDKAMTYLEKLLHPLVWEKQERFLIRCMREKRALAVLDIPLLFETGREQDMDAVVVVTAPEMIQRQRALQRMHMTEERFNAILRKQMLDAEKRRRADFIVHTGLGKAYSFKEVRYIVAALTGGLCAK